MPFLFSVPERDVVVGYHKVLSEAEGVAFSPVEEDVGDDRSDGDSQEVEFRVPLVPVDRGEHVIGAFHDRQRHERG